MHLILPKKNGNNKINGSTKDVKRNEIIMSDNKKSSPFYLETQQTNSSQLMLHTVAF